MHKPVVTTSWDDGSVYDPKLADLLNKYNIAATFYIPADNPERKVLKPSQIRQLSNGFEIGGHTLNHTVLTGLSLNQAYRQIVSGKNKIEDIIGKNTVSFCYPKGKFNHKVKQLVGFAGYKYARTVGLFGTKLNDSLISPTTIHALDRSPFIYLRYGLFRRPYLKKIPQSFLPHKWDNLAIAYYNWCRQTNGIFHLWGHSWEIEQNDDWNRLENVFSYITQFDNQYKTNSQLLDKKAKHDYYRQFNPKDYSRTYDTWYYKSELSFLKSLVSGFDKPGKRVLDLGCGTGRVSSLFNSADYLGVDFSEKFIRYAKKKYSKNFKHINITKPSSDIKAKYNLILALGIFEDSNDPVGDLADLSTILEPGGRVIVSVNNCSNPFFRLVKYLRSEFMNQPFYYNSFSPGIVNWYASLTAIKNLRIKTFGVLPPALPFIPAINFSQYGSTLYIIYNN